MRAFLLILLATGAAAAETSVPRTRSIWIAPTYQALFGEAFAPGVLHGTGLSGTYEFHLTPTFDLGLSLAYRIYPGGPVVQQVGYGALLRHFFDRDWASRDGVFPFVNYGLLLQQTFAEGREGSAVSHDTRLGAGLVVRNWGLPLYLDVAGHYSRIDQFDVPSQWIPYVEVQLGWVHTY